MSGIIELIDLLIPVVIGLLAKPVFSAIKEVITVIDSLPDWVQQILVVVEAWGLGMLAGLLMIQLPESLAQFDVTTVEALLGALFAMLRHEIEKDKTTARRPLEGA